MALRQFQVAIPSDMYSPAVDGAMERIGVIVRETWINLASERSASGAYLRAFESPDSLQYPYLGDRNQVGVINATPQADWIENGRAGFHLPQRWGTRKGKWKISKTGRKYAVVPFGHTTPTKEGGGSSSGRRRTAMPREIYNAAKKLEHGQCLTAGSVVRFVEEGRKAKGEKRKHYGSATVGQIGRQSKSYDYYRQVFGPGAGLQGLGSGYTWKTPKYEGLTRSTTTTPAGGRHTKYTTFRVITEDSPGWYIPPTPAHHYGRRALDQSAPEIEAMLEAAAKLDAEHAALAATMPLA